MIPVNYTLGQRRRTEHVDKMTACFYDRMYFTFHEKFVTGRMRDWPTAMTVERQAAKIEIANKERKTVDRNWIG